MTPSRRNELSRGLMSRARRRCHRAGSPRRRGVRHDVCTANTMASAMRRSACRCRAARHRRRPTASDGFRASQRSGRRRALLRRGITARGITHQEAFEERHRGGPMAFGGSTNAVLNHSHRPQGWRRTIASGLQPDRVGVRIWPRCQAVRPHVMSVRSHIGGVPIG